MMTAGRRFASSFRRSLFSSAAEQRTALDSEGVWMLPFSLTCETFAASDIVLGRMQWGSTTEGKQAPQNCTTR